MSNDKVDTFRPWEGIKLCEETLVAVPPHKCLVEKAEKMGESLDWLLRYALTQPLELNVASYNKADPFVKVCMIPGHPAGAKVYGPVPSDVMIVGKAPGIEEARGLQLFIGPSSQRLFRAMRDREINWASYYVSNVCRFYPPPGCTKSLKAEHKKICACLLAQELAIVNPRFLLLLGADAVKWYFGTKATLTKFRGAVIEGNGRKALAAIHPAQVQRDPTLAPGFISDMDIFHRMILGEDQVDTLESCDYELIKDEDELATLVDRLIRGGYKEFSVDCEWSGRNITDGSLRMIQVSWDEKKAAVIWLRDEGDRLKFTPNPSVAASLLNRLFNRDGVKIIGHLVKADLAWLEDMGINVLSKVHFDTCYAAHVLHETQDLELESLAVKYTTLGRYDLELQKWLEDNKVSKSDLRVHGYRGIPDHILIPYAARDADATLRIYRKLRIELDAYGEMKNLFYNIIMPAIPANLEMEMTGMLTDRERLVDILGLYSECEARMLAEFRGMVDDPNFNVKSVLQVRHLLFDELGLTPVKSTDSTGSIPWEEVMQLSAKEQGLYAPSTDTETLGILAADNDIESVRLLRTIRFVQQVTKNFLRNPDDDEYRRGLVSLADKDGRLRTTLNPLTTTGRQRSARPNMQNIPNKQEKELKLIAAGDPRYHPVRSCFVAAPGHVFVEADYVQAELCVLAYVSGDEEMKAVMTDPSRDLHSEMTIKMFGLDCHSNEVKGRYKSERIAAKSVNFGIPYQRGAKAISREISQEGVQCTQGDAQGYIDTFYESYPDVRDYVKFCKDSVRDPGYIETVYGRRRRFDRSIDEATLAAQQRESCNFPIQSTVADTLYVAMNNLWLLRRRFGLSFRFVLAVHDALILEVPCEEVPYTVNKLLPLCMCGGAKVPDLGLVLDIDVDICERWGEPTSYDRLEQLQIDPLLVNVRRKDY